MATDELYEVMLSGGHERTARSAGCDQVSVERIVDKRKNKKGEDRVPGPMAGLRYRGGHLGAGDSPEFNRQQLASQRESPLLRSTRTTSHPRRRAAPLSRATPRSPTTAPQTGHSPASNGSATNARKHISSRPPLPSAAAANCGGLLASESVYMKPSSPLLLAASRQSRQGPDRGSRSPVPNPGGGGGGLAAASPTAGAAAARRQGVDLAKAGIKILVPRSPMNSRVDAEESPSEGAHSLEAGSQEAHLVPPEVALLEKPAGALQLQLLRPGEERARMGSRPPEPTPRAPWGPPRSRVPVTPAAMRSLSGTGSSALMEASSAGGLAGSQSATVGVAQRVHGGKRRVGGAPRHRQAPPLQRAPDGERLPLPATIVVRKQDGFTHILLSTKTENNTLNPEVMKEIQSAMATAASDDSKLVLLGAVGNTFCYGLDFLYFIRRLTDDRKKESVKMAETIRAFVNTFIQFKKPSWWRVNGPAVGPRRRNPAAVRRDALHSSTAQTPDAMPPPFTFPRVMGVASVRPPYPTGF
ncbi:Chromodomain Y-like protein [Merluccius polli]|uniref:Chromodomain Y-like protein n=1 Tax=Merluccius polli TaxID=89951 RepID=A0AA47NTU7_MERPO|nr:Chromodomain Y-like protein [Merluccius polli]